MNIPDNEQDARAELRNMVYQVETRDFGGYSARDAHAVADALFSAGYRRTGQVIPESAIEAAARYYRQGAGVYVNRGDLRAILEASATHMLAEVWDEGEEAGGLNRAAEEYPELPQINNPYRPTP